MPEPMNDAEGIFLAALDRGTGRERAAYVEGACAGRPELLHRLRELLQAHEGSRGPLDAPPAGLAATEDVPPLREGPGTRIGPYKLLQRIGEGGMGVVFLAEQTEPVRRQVALKIIKPGMDSAQVIARFEAERQALALMDHPNIARVLDAGTTGEPGCVSAGRPYFVMELVHGVPITQFCDDHQLTPRERLGLFVPVCQAIQHAHQKGVIHRDLKPSNVLVTLYDDKPVPKVIDFGVAKAVEQRLTERTLFTQFGALVGTFEYMSPEQAEMNALGVDTRSDVYSLGVLLYELLTGTTPLEKGRLRQAALAELVRLIKEEEPPRPSVRLSSSGNLPKIAAARKTEPAKLSKLVRGEIDWIVMRCLEKDRSRRYDTASGLARDLERYLHDEPVEACPPGAGYRLRKFARRHQKALLVAAAFVLLLLAGTAVSTTQAVRAVRAEQEALAQSAAAQAAERDATAKRHDAEAARDQLRRTVYAVHLNLAQKAWESGDSPTARNLLDGLQPQRTGGTDLRGFEWHFLRRATTTELRSFKFPVEGRQGALSPDGTRFAAALPWDVRKRAGQGGPAVGLWETSSGNALRQLTASRGLTPESYVNLSFSPDGKRLAAACASDQPSVRDGGGLVVWDVETGREILALADLPGNLQKAVFDRAGGRVAAVIGTAKDFPRGYALKVWDVAGGRELFAIPLKDAHVPYGHAIAFSPDGTRLAVLMTGKFLPAPEAVWMVRVWDTGTRQEVLRFEAGQGGPGVGLVAFSPDGKFLTAGAFAAESPLKIRDAATGAEVLQLTGSAGGSAGGMAFSPDGAWLAAASVDGKIRLWDVAPPHPKAGRGPARTLQGFTLPLTAVAFSPDGRLVWAADQDGTVKAWEVAPRADKVVVPGPGGHVIATAAAGDAGLFAAVWVTAEQAEIRVWDASGRIRFAVTDALPGARVNLIRQLKLSRDGTRVAYSARDSFPAADKGKVVSRLRVWDVATRRELVRRDSDRGTYTVWDLSPDGRRLVTTFARMGQSRTSRTSVWDLADGTEGWGMDALYFSAVTFSPDGRRLAGSVAGPPGEDAKDYLRIWDATTGRVEMSRPADGGHTHHLAFNADGSLLARVSGIPTREPDAVQVRSAADGTVVSALTGCRGKVVQTAFSPDGRLVTLSFLQGLRRGELKVWDADGGRELLSLPTPGPWAWASFAFSRDGHRLFHVCLANDRLDAEVRVWDATPLPEEVVRR